MTTPAPSLPLPPPNQAPASGPGPGSSQTPSSHLSPGHSPLSSGQSAPVQHPSQPQQPPPQQHSYQSPPAATRRRTVVERLASAFQKATQRVSRQVRAGLSPHTQGPLILTIPPSLPALTRAQRKMTRRTANIANSVSITSPSHTDLTPTSFSAAGSNFALWPTEQVPVFRAAAVSQGAGFFAPSKEDRILFIDDLVEFVKFGYPRYDVDKFGDTMPAPPAERFIVPREDGEDGEEIGDVEFPVVNNFKLFAVFDGHCGQFASTFLQYRFPFELCGNASFKAGKYQQALTETYQSIHRELLLAGKYAPEAPNNDFSSGATASVVLVTPTRTYFAAVGDSPILVWRRGDSYPDIVFHEHDAENKTIHDHLVESNIFLVLVREVAVEGYYQREVATQNVYFLVTSKGIKQKVLAQAAAAAEAERAMQDQLQLLHFQQQQQQNILGDNGSTGNSQLEEHHDDDVDVDDGITGQEALDQRSPVEPEPPSPQSTTSNGNGTQQQQQPDDDIPFSDLRIGFSALNVFGTLGDSMYDMEVFNALIDELVAFREDRMLRYTQTMERLRNQERTGVIEDPVGVIMGPELEDTLTADLMLSTSAAQAAVAAYSNPAVAAGAEKAASEENTAGVSSGGGGGEKKKEGAEKKRRKGLMWKDKAHPNSNQQNVNNGGGNVAGGAAGASSSSSGAEEVSESEPDVEQQRKQGEEGSEDVKSGTGNESNGNGEAPMTGVGVAGVSTSSLGQQQQQQQPQGRKLSEIPHILFPFEVAGSVHELTQTDPADFQYAEFRWWIMSRPRWEYLRKHLSLLKKENHMSRVLLAALKNLNATHRLNSAGLLRIPETTSMANRDIALFVVASDGVIRFYDKFRDEFRGMVIRNSEDPEKITEVLKDYMKWLRDDRSVIACRYGFGTAKIFKDTDAHVPALSVPLHTLDASSITTAETTGESGTEDSATGTATNSSGRRSFFSSPFVKSSSALAKPSQQQQQQHVNSDADKEKEDTGSGSEEGVAKDEPEAPADGSDDVQNAANLATGSGGKQTGRFANFIKLKR